MVLESHLPFVQVGLYQECVEEYEVVLGDGSVVKASRYDPGCLKYILFEH